MLTKTSTSMTVPCFSNKERMSSVVQVQGTFWAINLVFENSPSSCSSTFRTGSWVVAEKWRTKLLNLVVFKGKVLVRGENGGRKQVEQTFLMELKLDWVWGLCLREKIEDWWGSRSRAMRRKQTSSVWVWCLDFLEVWKSFFEVNWIRRQTDQSIFLRGKNYLRETIKKRNYLGIGIERGRLRVQ